MNKITPTLWFDGTARQAAEFYTALFPDSRIDHITTAPGDYPAGQAGDVLVVGFTLMGQSYLGLNGGPGHPLTDAVSLMISCEDQAEVDRYWDALTGDGGAPVACGWCTDRFGLSWQVTPRRLLELMAGPDRATAARVMAAMMEMEKIDIAALEDAAANVSA